MTWLQDGSFRIRTVEEIIEDRYNIAVSGGYFTGTLTEFKTSNFGNVYYVEAQATVKREIEISQLYDNLKLYLIESGLEITENSLNQKKIKDLFNDIGLEVSLGSKSGSFQLAVNYTQNAHDDAKIADLLARRCYAYPMPMEGSITYDYTYDINSQKIVLKWELKADVEVDYKIQVNYTDNGLQQVQDEDSIRDLFLAKFNERYVWGSVIEPRRMLNEGDMLWAASVKIEHKNKIDTAYTELPITLEYFEKAVPTINVNDITLTKI